MRGEGHLAHERVGEGAFVSRTVFSLTKERKAMLS